MDDEDFCIDSRGWKILSVPRLRIFKRRVLANGFLIFVNPEGDVWEVETEAGPKIQLFTYAAAIRETAKAGRRMPTAEQWMTLWKSRIFDAASWWEEESKEYQHGECIYWWKKMFFAGCLASGLEHIEGEAWYWLLGEKTPEGHPCVRLANDEAVKYCLAPSTFGMAVRCLKDKCTDASNS